ncbi:ParB/RepB/Spo0J family partition protein [Rhizobium leguminosarum]|jgi:ParB family chromosome partitioning protein|uniref:Chromosome partitioning protein ParB n=2 Tax=Rhizobium leguminosarum TaxID=384 RepID=A0A1B8RCI1_RHILT|nr:MULTISPECIES: ParB/RepB/Spo0J family partition protein [Rhizobium]AOO90592.1 chromosome partitioning protein ParB [Rhizobium leguminosarum bv. trifolii]ASS55102.1 chromosome partitioning protein ParB [Rhizobium leguminosarum bv. viciae]AVC52118.1 parB/RepB/Spo0J family partition domain protein [Rhizobium leguminosarum bv. viciae]AXA40553.1 ParB/RepB/Spo0J family partition protein domain protein [Rhizobium leguminosarum]MBA8833218.1 ParB family chromosome partitioning protein [Rhizobium legu
MNDDVSKRRLGRGLAALIGEMDQPVPVEAERIISADRMIPIEFVSRNPRNPRRFFDDAELHDLASSIRQHGIVQPIVVRTMSRDRYEIIAGERRWRAAQLAGLIEIPVIVRDVDDKTALEIAIVENVQRADLNALEEALGYEQLIAEYGYTQNDLGEIIGKSRSHVANSLRLLKLPDPVRDLLAAGSLSAGHARALVSTSDPASLARTIVAKGMSVRDAEKLAQNNIKAQSEPQQAALRRDQKDSDTLALERTLSDALGLEVAINHKAGGGQIKISYKSLEQLEEICRLLERR